MPHLPDAEHKEDSELSAADAANAAARSVGCGKFRTCGCRSTRRTRAAARYPARWSVLSCSRRAFSMGLRRGLLHCGETRRQRTQPAALSLPARYIAPRVVLSCSRRVSFARPFVFPNLNLAAGFLRTSAATSFTDSRADTASEQPDCDSVRISPQKAAIRGYCMPSVPRQAGSHQSWKAFRYVTEERGPGYVTAGPAGRRRADGVAICREMQRRRRSHAADRTKAADLDLYRGNCARQPRSAPHNA